MERTRRRRRGTSLRDTFQNALEDLPEVRATEALAGTKRRKGPRNDCREEDEGNILF